MIIVITEILNQIRAKNNNAKKKLLAMLDMQCDIIY